MTDQPKENLQDGPTVYVNGDFVPLDQAYIPIMDRGFLFADSIYEVSAVIGGRLVDNQSHLARLDWSLQEVAMENPLDRVEIVRLQEELIRRNRLTEGIVYIQITRGVADRNFLYSDTLAPTVVMFTQSREILNDRNAVEGVHVVSHPDLRWARCDIKSNGLLAQVLAKKYASEQGAFEVIMVRDGTITEAGSSSFFIVDDGDNIIARPLSRDILPGITRKSVLKLAAENGIEFVERPFTLEEVYVAREAFLTSAAGIVLPVVSIDAHKIAGGIPGRLSTRLRQIYLAEVASGS